MKPCPLCGHMTWKDDTDEYRHWARCAIACPEVERLRSDNDMLAEAGNDLRADNDMLLQTAGCLCAEVEQLRALCCEAALIIGPMSEDNKILKAFWSRLTAAGR